MWWCVTLSFCSKQKTLKRQKRLFTSSQAHQAHRYVLTVRDVVVRDVVHLFKVEGHRVLLQLRPWLVHPASVVAREETSKKWLKNWLIHVSLSLATAAYACKHTSTHIHTTDKYTHEPQIVHHAVLLRLHHTVLRQAGLQSVRATQKEETFVNDCACICFKQREREEASLHRHSCLLTAKVRQQVRMKQKRRHRSPAQAPSVRMTERP